MKEVLPQSSSWDTAERMERAIPWGSSTCSKKPKLYPEEPGVIVRGKGCRVWDADGREFIDFRNGLGPVTLGYGFQEVDHAIRAQLDSGIVFGHPHPLEGEVAEMLIERIPCAEQARFLKTGGEALAACIRLARHVTGRDHIIQIGYNGWLNSLAPGARLLPGSSAPTNVPPPGVPEGLSALHHGSPWNDTKALDTLLDTYSGSVAAIIVAADYAAISAGHTFYPALRTRADKAGALLIFDEIVTGFRIAVGGVQEYFGVAPDLAVFSKGIANGMPLAAYVGRREFMSGLDHVIVSSTFGGETLSLAAARAVMQVYAERDVVSHLWRQGKTLWEGLNSLFQTYGIPANVCGFWPCPALAFQGPDKAAIRERFFRAAYRQGVSLYDVSYVNFSHTDSDIAEALERLETACRETS
ncbi:MAG: aminotransferase class III-fold pyridoxal phosphate-dependent enzyme [Armatimonadota bacterium]